MHFFKGRDRLEEAGLDERLILKWILKKHTANMNSSNSLVLGPVAVCCEHGDESLGSI
jgi:hypothetical protein